jgi:hypothetical protein
MPAAYLKAPAVEPPPAPPDFCDAGIQYPTAMHATRIARTRPGRSNRRKPAVYLCDKCDSYHIGVGWVIDLDGDN